MADASTPGHGEPVSGPPIRPAAPGPDAAPPIGSESGPFIADGPSGRKRQRKRRKRRSRWLLSAALILSVVAGAGAVVLGGWLIVTHVLSAERVLDAINVPGQDARRTLRDGDVLDVPRNGRLVVGGPDLSLTLIGGTRATVTHGAGGLDVSVDPGATVTAEAAFTAPARLRVVGGAVAVEATSGRLRLRRRGDAVAVAALVGPLRLDCGGTPSTIPANTWVAIGADGRVRAPRPAAQRVGMVGWWPGDEGGGGVLHECSGAGAPWPMNLGAATWGPDGISGSSSAPALTSASAPVPAEVAAQLLGDACSFELWLTPPVVATGAATAPLTVLDLTDGTGVDLRVRLPPLPLAPGRHHLVVTFGLDRRQVTWVDGRMHADVPAPVLPDALRPPLTLLLTTATTVRACAVFAATLGADDVQDLYRAGGDAP